MAGATITGAALISLIQQCAVPAPGAPPPPVAFIASYVMEETGGNPNARNVNRNGTLDAGITQINSTNWAYLGETEASLYDPCRAIAALYRLMQTSSILATGNPSRGFVLTPPGLPVSYAEHMTDPKYRVDPAVAAEATSVPPPTPPAAWNVFAPAGGAQFVYSQPGN